MTPSFVKYGNKLSDLVGVRFGLICFKVVHWIHLLLVTFGAAYMVHVGMNIDKKVELFEEVKKTLKPQSLFIIYDVMAVGTQPIDYPVPWSVK